MHAQDAFYKAAVFTGKRRDPELFIAASGTYIENVVFFGPLDFIRLLPGKQGHKGRISLFIPLFIKIGIDERFIF
ncbi:hypothetical protein HMPREF3201_00670 [Megasphaera sp. MJR8396C]|nr:hypothetical protein HMPREF3201_00670 [Megasphaera sp. MJR8396C]